MENAKHAQKVKDNERREKEKLLAEQRKLEVKTSRPVSAAPRPVSAFGSGKMPQSSMLPEGMRLVRQGGDSSDSIKAGGALDDIISAIRTGRAFGAEETNNNNGGSIGMRKGSNQGRSFEPLKTSSSNLLGLDASPGAASEPLLASMKSPSHSSKGQTKSIRAALKKMQGGSGTGSRGMSLEDLLLRVDVSAEVAASAPEALGGQTPKTAVQGSIGSLMAQ